SLTRNLICRLSFLFSPINPTSYCSFFNRTSKHLNVFLLSTFYHAFSVVASSIFGTQITLDRKSTRLNSSHVSISYAVFCLQIQILIFTILLVTSIFFCAHPVHLSYSSFPTRRSSDLICRLSFLFSPINPTSYCSFFNRTSKHLNVFLLSTFYHAFSVVASSIFGTQITLLFAVAIMLPSPNLNGGIRHYLF